MLQHARSSSLLLGQSAAKKVSHARSRGVFRAASASAATTTTFAACAGPRKGFARTGLSVFSGRRHGPEPTVASVSAALAMGGSLVVACFAVASASPGSATTSAALAADLTATAKRLSAVPVGVAGADGEEEKEGDKEKEGQAGDNESLVAAAHELRRTLAPPHQSLFRVVCILVYEDSAGNLHRITGTNAESSTIGSSICAERAAMCKLREASDCKRVVKVVVVTDNPGPLAPGVLCREFLSAHLPPSTPVVMSGSGYDGAAPPVLGGLMYDEELSGVQLPSPTATPPTPTIGAAAAAAAAAEGKGGDGGGGDVDDPCTDPAAPESNKNARVDPPTAVVGGPSATSTCACQPTTTAVAPPLPPSPSPKEAKRSPAGDVDGDGGGVTSEENKRAEDEGLLEVEGGRLGCRTAVPVVEVCTVGDLYPWRNMYGLTERGDQLRLGFLKQQGAEELSKPGLVETLGLDSGVLEAYDAAWRATAEDSRDGVHPIRYAAVALFPDGQAEITHQLKALEYGATLDPVTLLAPAMMKRAKDGVRPSWVILADQFGLMHAPFAQARTFLTEHGFGETRVVLHGEDGAIVVVKAKDLVPNVTAPR